MMRLDYIERKRLAALARTDLFDARAKESFQRFVVFVAEAFDVSIATISLVDETRQIYLARHGIESQATPRGVALCDRTIRANRTTIVLDTALDPGWQGNPLVTAEPGMRFYAGVPLRLDGQPVGTLCVIDTRPRNRFTDAERLRLESCAAMATEMFELHLIRIEQNDAQERFERMAEACPDAMVIADETGSIRFWNPGAQRLLGFEPAVALTMSVADCLPDALRYTPGDFRAMFDPYVGRTQEMTARSQGGAMRTVEFSLASWREKGHLFYGGVLRDVSERRRNEEALHRLAHHDALTELPNRTVMRHRLSGDLASRRGAAVLLVDLDGFKDVNDRLGHVAGDVILRDTAQRLLASVRPTDTVTRFGGDEFAILLHGCQEVDEAARAADRIVAAMEEPFLFEGGPIRLGASVGVALAPSQADRIDDLLSCADLALYHAKAAGRHCHRLYSPNLRRKADERHRFRHEIHRALDRGEFVLHYQPQVRLKDRALVGAEALIRWQHPEHGLLMPGTFLPSVNGSRDEQAVGDWVMLTARRQAVAWRALGFPDFRMGVNACASRLQTGEIVQGVIEALRASALPARNLELEITEATILHQDDRLIADLSDLRDRGVSIAFDDYGTGFASLSLLKHFPLSRLKIDRSFVSEMTKVADVALIRAILQLAQSFGLGVIAEGIETEDQLQRLRRKGCEEGQGFLFSKGLPADEFERLFLTASVEA